MSHHTLSGDRGPSPFTVAQALHAALKEWRKMAKTLPADHDGTLDVRLCVREDRSWFLATGDVQYDTEHTAHCGAGAIWPTMLEDEVMDLALTLITETEDE